MIKNNLIKGGFASMIDHYISRKRALSVITIDAYGTRVPELCPNTVFLQVTGRFRGSKTHPEVHTT